MQQLFPDPEDSDEAREGTAAHWYVSELLNGRDVVAGAIAPNGVPISAEMVDCAQDFLIDIRDTLAAWSGAQMYVEQRFYMRSVHPDNWGTPDVVIVDVQNRRLHVWDYKYGHRFVDAQGNLQLIDYAIGVFDMLGMDPDAPFNDARSWHDWRISISIGQPRNYSQLGPIREWYLSGAALRDYLPQFRQAAAEAVYPDAPLRTNEHCRDCSARHACPALERAAALAMDVSLRSQPVQLSPHAVGLELRQIEDAERRLDARKTGLQEQALGMIRSGTIVPFYTTEYASGREKFTCTAEEAFMLGDLLGADFRKKPEPITPNQARAELKKLGIDGEVISSYADKPRGALRLTRVNDDAAKLAFGME